MFKPGDKVRRLPSRITFSWIEACVKAGVLTDVICTVKKTTCHNCLLEERIGYTGIWNVDNFTLIHPPVPLEDWE
jgi:hypothetical protein